jgi:hypothetical protein
MTEPVDEALDGLAQLPPPAPPAMSAELEAELGRLAPVAPRRPGRQLAALIAASLVYGGALIAVLSVRRDASELPVAWLAGAAIAWLVGFAIPCYLALVPRAGAMTARWEWATASAIVVSIGFVALGLAVHPMGAHSTIYGWARFARGHWCLELGLATALVPVVLGAWFLRGAVPVASRWIAATLGAGAGCLGGLVLHVHCPIADGPHIGLVHGGVVAVAATLSAALVPRVTDRPLR